MNSVYILWQDQVTTLWHPVAKLTRERDLYRLNYTRGANASNNFTPFPNMDNLDKVYESHELLPILQNRILPKSRPEFKDLISWLDLDPVEFDPLDYLSITGGVRKTDNYRILKLPDLIDGKYIYDFLISGIHYLNDDAKCVIENLKEGEELQYYFETNNPVDKRAIALTEKKSGCFIGYCPRYLVRDFRKLIEGGEDGDSIFRIKKVNSKAPASYRVICSFESLERKDYKPLMFDEYMAHTIVHEPKG